MRAEALADPREADARVALIGFAIFAISLIVCAFAYLAHEVPGPWFPSAARLTWDYRTLAVTRGVGTQEARTLVLSAPDATGIAVVSLSTDFRAVDYPGVAWIVEGLGERADVRLLWRSDTRPDRLNSVSLRVEAGRVLPVNLHNNPAWIGRITGLALAIHGSLVQPARIFGVVAKPMGVVEMARDRVSEWVAFERWNGASINTITGGADVQDVPLPLLIAAIVLISSGIVLLASRWTRILPSRFVPVLLVTLFIAGWFVLDTRWAWNLVRQERETAHQYWGKTEREKHLAGEDGPLYAFLEKALDVLPKQPARIIVAADADYFRGRAAYHLYPHNVYFSPRGSAMPPAAELRPGDWLLVFLRQGVQFDASKGQIRWDGTQTVSGEARLVDRGSALFLIR